MEFEFGTATRIVFGRGRMREVGSAATALGTCALIVTGRNKSRARSLEKVLLASRVRSAFFQLTGEPTLHDIREGVRLAKLQQCDVVIGFGGGSAIDAAKAIAAMLTNPGDLSDYLEVIGAAKPLPLPCAPCLAVPTTAGTGAEVTRNSVLASPEHRFKVSLRSPFLLPKAAFIDPDLTTGLPPALTAITGLDALTQLIEPYVSLRANPLTDGFCVEGLRRVARSLRKAVESGLNGAAREDMALASLLSGLALANAALGAVHGFAAPLGGMYAGPHGGFCAAVLPYATEVNLRCLRDREPNNPAGRRYTEVARILTGSPAAESSHGIAWLKETCSALGVPRLKTYGVRQEDFPELIDKAGKASSMKGNPVRLTINELGEILEKSF